MSITYLAAQAGTGRIYVTTANTGTTTGDIDHTSFSANNNQVGVANVTGLAFNAASVRSARIFLTVDITATGNLYEMFEIQILNRDAGFDIINYNSIGDNSGVVFSVTTAGQIQYTSTNITGFVSDAIRFRATVTSV